MSAPINNNQKKLPTLLENKQLNEKTEEKKQSNTMLDIFRIAFDPVQGEKIRNSNWYKNYLLSLKKNSSQNNQ